MHRLALFVEGFTEVLFVERLITEIAGKQNVIFEKKQIRGGSKAPRRVVTLEAVRQATHEQFYVLIVDCGGDRQVKDRILQEHESLTKKGFVKIFGLRDVRPDFLRADIPKLEAGLRKYVKTSLAPVEFILAVMEIEAWFLAEHNHFHRIDPTLTPAVITASLGFNPATSDMSLRAEPAADLDACYQLAGKRYMKGDPMTVEALDYAAVYLELQDAIPYLNRLSDGIGDFIALGKA